MVGYWEKDGGKVISFFCFLKERFIKVFFYEGGTVFDYLLAIKSNIAIFIRLMTVIDFSYYSFTKCKG